MSVLIVAIGIGAIIFGVSVFAVALFKALYSGMKYFYLYFVASESHIDECYKSEVVKVSPEYKEHLNAVDKTLKDILK